MENVDRMIFDSLINDLHCSFGCKSSLQELRSDDVVEAIIRCIWRCRNDGTKIFPSYQMPGSPLERFRFASKISAEIQALGIKEQIGYQTLLYPNLYDSRQIFLSLFEKFPKETVETAEKKLSPLERLKAEVGEAISGQLNEGWTPEFCRFYDLQRIGHFWYSRQRRDDHSADFWAIYKENLQADKKWRESTEPLVKIPPKIASKPKLPPKPKIQSSFEEENKIEIGTTEVNEFADRNSQLQITHKSISSMRANLAQKRQTLLELRFENFKIAENNAKQRSNRPNDDRLFKLLDDPKVGLQKLENYLSEANERRIAYEEKFIEAERERLDRLEEFGGRKMTKIQRKNGKLAELEKGMTDLEEIIEQRKRIRQKMYRECEKMTSGGAFGDGIGRSKYVRRILEISAMVGKQNEEIRRTANSVQTLRREIDQLMGSLERTFIVVNRWLMSKHVESNPKMQKAHKLLVRTHEQCAIVKECIEDQGQMSRQIDELKLSIDVEMQKSVDEQLERLLDDLMLIKQDNAELERMAGEGRR